MDNYAQNVGLPSMWQPGGMNEAASGAFGGIQNLNNFANVGQNVLGPAGQTASNLYNNPYAQQGQAGANLAGGMGEQAALMGFGVGGGFPQPPRMYDPGPGGQQTGGARAYDPGPGGGGQTGGGRAYDPGPGGQQTGGVMMPGGLIGAGGNVMQSGQSLVPYAQQIMNTGFDPQNQLYDRTLQQVQDQTRAGQAARGINMTPYGAGQEADATRNFNIDWQNQQLGRQSQAGGAAANLVGTGAGVQQTGANIAGQGVNMMNQAPGNLVRSAMIPYATYSDIGQGQNNALSSLLGIAGGGANLANMPVQDWLQYLGMGNQANQVANQRGQLGLNQANMGWNQLGQLGQGLGSLFGSFF